MTWGVAFQVSKHDYCEVMSYLCQREKGYTLYSHEIVLPHKLDLRLSTTTNACVFVGENLRENPEYLGPASVEDMAESISLACGSCGPSYEYLFNLATAMRRLVPGYHDDHLFQLEFAVRRRLYSASS